MPSSENSLAERGPKVGDIVSFMVRPHPTMGAPYEVIGRVEAGAGRLHAGGRYLPLSGVEVIRPVTLSHKDCREIAAMAIAGSTLSTDLSEILELIGDGRLVGFDILQALTDALGEYTETVGGEGNENGQAV